MKLVPISMYRDYESYVKQEYGMVATRKEVEKFHDDLFARFGHLDYLVIETNGDYFTHTLFWINDDLWTNDGKNFNPLLLTDIPSGDTMHGIYCRFEKFIEQISIGELAKAFC